MKKTEDKKVIKQIKEQKKYIFNLVLVSIILALAVNLLATGINNFNILPPWLLIVISLGIFLICFVSYKIYEIKSNTKVLNMNGFFVTDNKEKKLMAIPDYSISENMSSNIMSAFYEDKGLENIWKNSNIGISTKQEKNGVLFASPSPATKLLIELMQYCILSKISMFVSDYFNNLHMNGDIESYDREKLSELVLKNRFIKLFSEPMENRQAFNKNAKKQEKQSGQIVCAYSENAYFHKFEFNLPKKTVVRQKDANTIEFNMNNFVVTIKVLFAGFNTFIPPDLLIWYAGINDYTSRDYKEYRFDVKISIKQKVKTMFTHVKWVEYDWIDGLVQCLFDYLDKKTFLENINWNNLQAQILVYKNFNKQQDEK